VEGRVLELGIEAGRARLTEEWQAVRRGWYVGGQVFRERLLGLAEKPLRQARSASLSGGAKREHGEARAERMLAVGLAVVGLAQSDLPTGAKGALRKQVLAWWLCRHTAVHRRWVSQRLHMGDESGVTRAIRCVQGQGEAEVASLKGRLERAVLGENGQQP
jgi:hypothetical protein